MERKILKAELGIQLQEDKDRVYLVIDSYEVFNGGLPKALKSMVEKSYSNLVDIRRNDKKSKPE